MDASQEFGIVYPGPISGRSPGTDRDLERTVDRPTRGALQQ